MWRDSTIVRTATQHTDTDTIYRRYIVTFTRIWPGNTGPMFAYYYVSPLYTEGETYRFTSHRSFLCHICFVSVHSAPELGQRLVFAGSVDRSHLCFAHHRV